MAQLTGRLLVIALSLFVLVACQSPAERGIARVNVARLTPVPGDGRLTAEKLPFEWKEPVGGAASTRAVRILLEFESPSTGHEIAVMIEGVTIVFSATLNGTPVHATGEAASPPITSSSSRAAPTFRLPVSALRTGANQLELVGFIPRGCGWAVLGSFLIGRADAVERAALASWLLNHGAPLVIAAVLIAVGLVSIGLWRGRSDSQLFLLLAAGSMLWGVQGLMLQWPVPLPPRPNFEVLIISLYVWYPMLIAVFFLRFADVHSRLFERAAATFALVVAPLLYVAYFLGEFALASTAARGVVLVFVSIALVVLMRYAWRAREWTGTLLFIISSICVLFGVRDFIASLDDSDWGVVMLGPYSGVALLLFAGWMLLERYHRAFENFEELNRDLEGRVASANAELHRRLEQVGAAHLTAERANVSKSRFFAAASHDLRQPLHSLGLFAAALKERVVDPESRDLARRIGDSIEALDRLFDELLDLSRLDAGTVEVRRRPLSLQSLFERLDSEFRDTAAAKGLRLRLVPTTWVVDTDPVLLERVLVNLVSNAMRYTKTGGVLVAARRRGAAVRLEVRDTGVGIPTDQQSLVFDEFYQVGNPGRDRRQGLGLGLAIVRRLTTLLGHRLTLDSVVGRGTRFTLELPLADRAADMTTSDETVRDEPFHGRCVLLVDDEPDILAATATLLNQWGCAVQTASGLTAALELIRTGFAPDVLLADLRLDAEHDGIDVIARVRAVLCRKIPALLISGDTGARELERVRQSGLLLLTKPVAPAKLRSALHALLSAERAPGAV
jgi:signal transduction histidine kinase/CheY-like chemotaxis protein